MRVKLGLELTQLRDHAYACLFLIFLHQLYKALHHAVVLARDLLELIARPDPQLPMQLSVPHITKCCNNLIHRTHLLRCLAAHTEDDEWDHEKQHGEEDRRSRCELCDAAADGKNGIDGEKPVQHGLLRHIELLPIHRDQTMCVRKLRNDLMKDRVAKDRHRGKWSASGTICDDNVHLLTRLEAFREFLHRHDKEGIALCFC